MILSATSANLVFLRSMMLASKLALVWKSVHAFFSCLHFQMCFNVWAINHVVGRFSSLSTFRSRNISFFGVMPGETLFTTLISQLPTSMLYLHVKSAWERQQTLRESHRVHVGLVTLGRILCSLCWVGKMLWIILNKKVYESDVRPGMLASDQVFSQSLSGFSSSILHLLSNLKPIFHYLFGYTPNPKRITLFMISP